MGWGKKLLRGWGEETPEWAQAITGLLVVMDILLGVVLWMNLIQNG